MNIKIIIIITISVIIILALLYFLFFYNNKNEQNIISILELPITEDQILKKESLAQSDNSTILILNIDHDIQVEKSSLFDISSYEGSKLYDDLTTLISENDMSIDEAEIKIYHVEYSIKKGFFNEDITPRSVYIITGNRGNTIVYTSVPAGVVLPREYRPQ